MEITFKLTVVTERIEGMNCSRDSVTTALIDAITDEVQGLDFAVDGPNGDESDYQIENAELDY